MNVIWNVSILDIERSYPLHVLHQEAPLLVFNDPPFNTPLSFSFLCNFIVETSFVVGWHLLEIYFNPELVISDQSGDRIKNIYKIEKKKLKKNPLQNKKKKVVLFDELIIKYQTKFSNKIKPWNIWRIWLTWRERQLCCY